MALIFNPYSLYTVLPQSLVAGTTDTNSPFANTTSYLYVYPTTVAFPSSTPANIANTFILAFTLNSSYNMFATSQGVLQWTLWTSATATGSGTAGWWLATRSQTSTAASICCNSIGVVGSNNMVTLSQTNIANNSVYLLTSFTIRTQ